MIKRSVEIPLTFSAGSAGTASWPEIDEIMKRCWDASTSAANEVVRRLWLHDVEVCPGEHLPKWTDHSAKPITTWAYQSLVHCDWLNDLFRGVKKSMSCITKQVAEKYSKDRFEILCKHSHRLTAYRYPYPWMVHNQDWRLSWESAGPVLTVTNGLIGCKQMRFALRSGKEFRRQTALLGKLTQGDAKQGQLSFHRKKVSGSKGHVLIDREPGGGTKEHYKIIAKMTLTFEADRKEPLAREVVIQTDPAAMFVIDLYEERSPLSSAVEHWIYNGDHVFDLLRWMARHRCYLQRISEDQKFESRKNKRRHKQINGTRCKRCHKHRNRLDTWIQQATASLVNYCARKRVKRVRYVDDCRDYLGEKFQWFQLRRRLQEKVVSHGIEFQHDGERKD